MKKLLLIFVLFFLLAMFFTIPAQAQRNYIIDGKLIAPEEFEQDKAAPLSFIKLTGEDATTALAGVFEFDGEAIYLLTEDGKEQLEDGYLSWYSPEYGIALIEAQYPSVYDVVNRAWLADGYDPACSKTSPNGLRRIICTPEFDGQRSYYYEEKVGDTFKIVGNLGSPLGADLKYYWADDESIKYLQYEAHKASEELLPAAGRLINWEYIKAEALELEESQYDKSRVAVYKTQNIEEASASLATLMTHDEQRCVTSLKTRSGKEFYVPKHLVFDSYYPELDIVTLTFEDDFSSGLFIHLSFNLASGEVAAGAPDLWALSPDGRHRLNMDNCSILEKLGKNGFEKVAAVGGVINPVYKSLYWADNETLHYLRIIDGSNGRRLVPMAAKILE